MNRPIKFRARHKLMGEMLYFSHGFTELAAFLEELDRTTGGGEQDYDWMQFTGLTDKNGREIYEGDVIRPVKAKVPHMDGKTLWEIWWNSALVCFELRRGDVMLGMLDDEIASVYFEVIGNICENPELLETLST